MIQFDEKDAAEVLTRINIVSASRPMFPDEVMAMLNQMIGRKRDLNVPKELTAVANTTSWPVVSLDIRIQEFIKGMVGGLLLNEHEVKELVIKAYNEAVAALDWKDMMKTAIEHSISSYADRAAHNAVEYAFRDAKVKDALRDRMIELLKRGGDLWGE